jgi:hypothetical protein
MKLPRIHRHAGANARLLRYGDVVVAILALAMVFAVPVLMVAVLAAISSFIG